MSEIKFGTPEWRTHMRRSLAQRKRHGEKITDIEGLIDYIEKKGPAAKDVTKVPTSSLSSNPKPQKSTNKIVRNSGRKIVTVDTPIKRLPQENGLYNAPTVVGGR